MPAATRGEDGARQSVIRYYKASHKSFVRVWSGKHDRSIHFGYYDPGVETHPAAMIRMNEVAADLAGLRSGDIVIDAGCGFGGSTVWLAEQGAKHVYGINIVPHQIEIAQGVADERNVADRTSFLQADFAAIPLEEGSVDVFWAIESMVHAPDPARVVAEAFRLLRPGGRIMVIQYFVRSDPTLDAATIPHYDKILSGWAMPPLLTIPAFEEQLESAGFTNVRSEVMTESIAPSLKRMKKIAAASLWVTRPLAALGLYDQDRVAHADASVALADAHLAGQLEYAAIVAGKPVPPALHESGAPSADRAS